MFFLFDLLVRIQRLSGFSILFIATLRICHFFSRCRSRIEFISKCLFELETVYIAKQFVTWNNKHPFTLGPYHVWQTVKEPNVCKCS